MCTSTKRRSSHLLRCVPLKKPAMLWLWMASSLRYFYLMDLDQELNIFLVMFFVLTRFYFSAIFFCSAVLLHVRSIRIQNGIRRVSLLIFLVLQGVSVRVRRPSDYNPSMAATLGPSQPSPHLNLAAVGLTPGYVRSSCLVVGAMWPCPDLLIKT